MRVVELHAALDGGIVGGNSEYHKTVVPYRNPLIPM